MDVLFTKDNHGGSTKLIQSKEIGYRIQMLLFMKPGEDPWNPDKGVDIRQYIGQQDVQALGGKISTSIKNQIAKYTDIIISNVIAVPNGNYLAIAIQLAGMDDILTYNVSSEGNSPLQYYTNTTE